MDENEFEIGFVRFIAIPSEDMYGLECKDCALRNMTDECEDAKCRPIDRIDGRNVIFVEKQQ